LWWDIAVLRAEPRVFGLVASDPTVSRTIDALAADAPAALKAICASPPDQRWLVNGLILLTNQDGARFGAWYTDKVAGSRQLDKLEGNYSWLCCQQGATAAEGQGPW
jgi:hypothetical protein